jgi:hypothetical protein
MKSPPSVTVNSCRGREACLRSACPQRDLVEQTPPWPQRAESDVLVKEAFAFAFGYIQALIQAVNREP